MCTKGYDFHWHSAELYERFGETLDDYLVNTVKPGLQAAQQSLGSAAFLAELQQSKKMYTRIARKVAGLFKYLDLSYAHPSRRPPRPQLKEVGEKCFQTHIYDGMKSELVAAVVGLVREQRAGNDPDIDRSLVVSYLELYEKEWDGNFPALKEALVSDAKAYYLLEKRAEWMNRLDYHVIVQDAMEAERDRFADTCVKDCIPDIQTFLQEEMMESRDAVCFFSELHVKNAKSSNE